MKLRRFCSHLAALFGELWCFARTNKVWWILPVAVILLALAFVLVSVSTISPFIYSLF